MNEGENQCHTRIQPMAPALFLSRCRVGRCGREASISRTSLFSWAGADFPFDCLFSFTSSTGETEQSHSSLGPSLAPSFFGVGGNCLPRPVSSHCGVLALVSCSSYTLDFCFPVAPYLVQSHIRQSSTTAQFTRLSLRPLSVLRDWKYLFRALA